ncbi:putative coiled-coil domain-containing protein [Apostichopus japonicus]|uniref:Putative coiled-coil domain-containing protein n=1 Tax=Stichopus japonicus TaxID=307972 RepID=A0A2G8LFZ2_STIJA|nr:putative coiled-coil domain-containing protein [Apostichopus japonicus]
MICRMKLESLKEESRSVPQLYKELDQLRRQNETALGKLQSSMLSLEEERKKCGSLEKRLNETEGKWEGVVNRYENNEQDLKTKLNQLSRELEASKDDMARSHREIMKLKAEQDRLLKEQEKARELKREVEKVGNIEATMEDFKKDRDVLAKELQVMLSKEKANHVTATSVEVIETEKKTLKEQLNGSLKRQSDLHQDLIKLQSEHQDLKSEFTTTKENLRSTEEVVAVLRGELSRKSKELMNTFDFSREGQAKMEFEVVHLQRNIEEERKSFVKDNCDLKLMLEVEQKKNEELTRVLKEKTEEVANLRREVSRLSLNSIKLDERVQEELKQRQNVDSRNKVLEEELDKLWSQLKEVMDKHAANELSKTELEGELFRIPELQEELDSTLLRLETVQTQASDLAASRKELHVLKEDQIKLKLQLQEDKVYSSLIAQQLEETQEHLKSAEEREKQLAQINSDLKYQLLTTQSELTTIGDKHKNVEDLVKAWRRGRVERSRTENGIQVDTLSEAYGQRGIEFASEPSYMVLFILFMCYKQTLELVSFHP